tara:strand:- start:145 stop:510 length:366 start_codon:yes stop_codon:yes gene_type:complete
LKGWREIKQTLNSLVRNECCNLVQGSCLGVDLFGKRFRSEGECWIFQKKPCTFFTTSVLPLEPQLTEKYRKLTKDIRVESHETRLCECGEYELHKRERYCEKCREKKELESKRRYWHKQKA